MAEQPEESHGAEEVVAEQDRDPGGFSKEEVAEAARVAARAQAVLEMEQNMLAEEEAREEWEAAENRRINHAVTLSIAARDFAEAGDFKAAVGSARQALGLDATNVEARAVLNYCRSYRRAARSAAPTRPNPRRGTSKLGISSRYSLSTTSLSDGPAFAVLDGDATHRTVIGSRPVSASSSFTSVESSLNRKPRTLYVLKGSSSATSQRRGRLRDRSVHSGDKSDETTSAVQPQLSYQLLRESGSTSWVTVGPAPGDMAWTGDRELLERVENLESALADILPEPQPEPEIPSFEAQTTVSGESIDVWNYVYVQAAHLYGFVSGEVVEVLNRRRVTNKENGEEKIEETWHPAVVTRYNRPYLSDEERVHAEIEARQRDTAEDTEKGATPAIFDDDDGAKAAAKEARQARRAAARAQALETELCQLSVGGLRARAAGFGIKNTRIETAWKSSDPNKELIDLIVGFAEEAHESDEEVDRTEAEAEAHASCRQVGLLESWSVHFVYVDGREPPRWRAGQPLHGAEVSLLLAPPRLPTGQADAATDGAESMSQQGVDMVRRIGRQSLGCTVEELELLEAAAAKETQEEYDAAVRASAEHQQAVEADARADEEEKQAIAAAAALAEELEESALAQAQADAQAKDIEVAQEALRLAIEGGDEEAIAVAKAALQKEIDEADESRLQAQKEEAEANAAKAHFYVQEEEAKAAREQATKERAEAEHYRLIYEKEKIEAAAARAAALDAAAALNAAQEDTNMARTVADKERAVADKERAEAEAAKAKAEAAQAALVNEQKQLAQAQAETAKLRDRIRLMEDAEAQRLKDEAAKAQKLAVLAEEEQVPMSQHLAALDESEARAVVLARELADLQTDHQRLHAMYVAAKHATSLTNLISPSGRPPAHGSVFCTVVACDNLLVADSTSSDPFVAVWFGDEEQIHRAKKSVAAIPKKPTVTNGTVNSGWCRTEVLKNTLSPTFGAEFEFKVAPDFSERDMHLHVRVFDHDRLSSSEQLGECDIDLCRCFGEDWNRWNVKKFSDTVELTDHHGKVKKKFVKRKLSDLVDATIDDANSQCDLKQTLLKKTIYGRLAFELRFQPGSK